MLNKIYKVAQREYLETVRTKMFILSVLLVPFLIGGIIFFSHKLSQDKGGPRPARRVAVADRTRSLSGKIVTVFEEYNASNPEQQIILEEILPAPDREAQAEEQKKRLKDKSIHAYVVLDQDVLDGSGKIRMYLFDTKASELEYVSQVEHLLNRAVVNQRCENANLKPELLAQLRQWVPSERVQIGESGQERVEKESERVIGMMVPFFFMFLMFQGVFGMGHHMITSVIEEKNSRVIEVLLSALSPFELMAGKILGLAAIGLTVMSLWGVAAYGTAVWQGFDIEITIEMLTYFIVYYCLGFILFCSILAGIGSICNTLKEAQSLMFPVTMMFILPLVSWVNMVQNPDGIYARVLSFIPPLTPMVMVLRLSASSTVALWEICLSLLLLVMSVPAVMFLAARIFRIGILMYGKRPGPREIIRWIRAR
ncbi:MAG: ABC transporter permease [Sedimentisphaerales bacterium]|nr:ABC transporter permease [Sedimentisphaerales bacterium]